VEVLEVLDEDTHLPSTRQTLLRRMSSAMRVFKHKKGLVREKHTDKVTAGYMAGLEARIVALEVTQLALKTNNNKLNQQVYILKKCYLDLHEKSSRVPTVQHSTLPDALSKEIKCASEVLKPVAAREGNDRLDSLQARIALGRKRQLWL
jgi:hypothetical protein